MMEVILLERVRNLGDIGDQFNVKGGYGRNYLIPQNKAVFATPEKIALIQQQKAELQKVASENLQAAQRKAEALSETKVCISHSAGEQGKLYGSVTTKEIADSLALQGHDITKKELNLVQGAIREVGTYQVEIHLHPDVVCTIEVEVIPD